MDTEGNFTDPVSNDWIEYEFHRADVFSDGLAFLSDSNWGYKSTQGLANMTTEAFATGAYINYKGERVIEFPQYKGQKYYGFPFHNGYAVLLIRGADQKTYFTAIDKNGKEMFSPKECYRAYLSSDGKYVINVSKDLIVMDIHGEPLVSISYSGSFGYPDIYDGMLYFGGYINIEEKKALGRGLSSDYKLTVY